MANYIAICRTNLFRAQDVDAFREAIAPALRGTDLGMWVEGGKVGFGGYGSLPFAAVDLETGEVVDFDLIATIQQHLAAGEKAVLVEIGYEKLRYVGGFQITITPMAAGVRRRQDRSSQGCPCDC